MQLSENSKDGSHLWYLPFTFHPKATENSLLAGFLARLVLAAFSTAGWRSMAKVAKTFF